MILVFMFLECRASIWVWASVVFLAGALCYPLRAISVQSDPVWLGVFPAFAHAAFFTFALATLGRMNRRHAALFVGVASSAFEFMQHAAIWNSLPLPSVMMDYAAHGTFDSLDVAVTWIGVLVGLRWLRHGFVGDNHRRSRAPDRGHRMRRCFPKPCADV